MISANMRNPATYQYGDMRLTCAKWLSYCSHQNPYSSKFVKNTSSGAMAWVAKARRLSHQKFEILSVNTGTYMSVTTIQFRFRRMIGRIIRAILPNFIFDRKNIIERINIKKIIYDACGKRVRENA
jgi:hypothetical protein